MSKKCNLTKTNPMKQPQVQEVTHAKFKLQDIEKQMRIYAVHTSNMPRATEQGKTSACHFFISAFRTVALSACSL